MCLNQDVRSVGTVLLVSAKLSKPTDKSFQPLLGKALTMGITRCVTNIETATYKTE